MTICPQVERHVPEPLDRRRDARELQANSVIRAAHVAGTCALLYGHRGRGPRHVGRKQGNRGIR